MEFSIQPVLQGSNVMLLPLEQSDFETLYVAASDPKVWEQHPNKDRWKREVFEVFFQGALESKGAFKILDTASNEVIGSTRFYQYEALDNSIMIGYTFYATKYWGTGTNPIVKGLMLDYIFQFVDKVYFQVGASNVRSQIAIARVGAKKVAEEEIAYHGELPKLNFRYQLDKADWDKNYSTEQA